MKVKYTTTGYTFPIPYDTDSPAPVAGNQWIGSTGASWSAKDDKCLSVRVFATPSTDNQTATDPVASSITSTSASISWTGSGAQSYRVKYRLKGDVDFLTKDATASPTTISSLYQDTTYYVSISTEIDDVWGAYTSEVPFNTTHDAAVATRVYVDNITAKTARISWNAIGAQRYQIVYQNITDGDAVKLAYSSGSSITISNLIPLKTYRVWMRSNVTGSWPGEWYGFVEFVPQDDRTPTTVIVSDITGTTARASWDGAGADSYQVVLRNVATGASTYYYTPASYRDFSGLSPGTEYSVVVRAKIDGSWPPSFCEATIFNTIADGRFPGDLAVSNITQTSAKFTWTGAGATLYTINFANLSTGASVYRSLLNGPRTESNLSPGTPYMARIRAYIDGAYTPFSDPIYFETLSGKSLLSDYSGGKDNGFVVFPNPVLEKADVLFASEATGKGEISVFDLQGKKHLGLIVDFLPGNNVYELNMGNLSQGIYIVSMFDGENIQYYKVIKQ
ncbi:MAG: T9SS type A sorting domain-containing protein [Bacteroidetes bacterium]|nr:T9SS type A sorting domain-containing protein [Bacteroidota bacterium]